MANLSDNFNRADDPDDLGANWTTDTGELNISSNTAVGIAGSSNFNRARYTGTALDSNDHDCQADLTDNAEHLGISIRQASSTATYYFGHFWGPWGGGNSWSIGKNVSGAETVLDNATDQAWPEPSTVWIEIDGTSLSGTINAGDALSATDSAISSGTYAGIAGGWEHTGVIDDWSANDLAAGGATIPILAYHYNHNTGSNL